MNYLNGTVLLFTSELVNGIHYRVKLSKAFFKNPLYLKYTDKSENNFKTDRKTIGLDVRSIFDDLVLIVYIHV